MVKLLSLFSGIGAFEKALQNLDIPFELVAYCEIDKYASKAYSVLHNAPESMNLGDITKVDETTLPTDIDYIRIPLSAVFHGRKARRVQRFEGKGKSVLRCASHHQALQTQNCDCRECEESDQ